MITAGKVYKEILNMQVKEREKLFAVIARKGFEKDSYSHEEVFGDIRESPFILREAAEYLDVAEITLRRWVQSGLIQSEKVGRNIVFDPNELKRVKRSKAKKR
jgi:excisionase family DNA binding protein